MHLQRKIEETRYVAVNYFVRALNQLVTCVLDRQIKQQDTHDVFKIWKEVIPFK